MEIKLRSFESQILYFNGIYKLPISKKPSLEAEANWQNEKFNNPYADSVRDYVHGRFDAFYKILKEEVEEFEDLKDNVMKPEVSDIDILVELADLLGDITVYCASEAARFGIPLPEVLRIIMESNFSKLDNAGNPIYDERGKVMKGPLYWKPEPRIKQLLEDIIHDR